MSGITIYSFYSISEEKMNSSPSKNDSLRHQLEEIVNQMLLVWAKEGIALNVVSGEKNGMRIVFERFAMGKTNRPTNIVHSKMSILHFNQFS